MINNAVKKLITYGIENNLINLQDRVFIVNRILEVLNIQEYEEPAEEYKNVDLDDILKEILDYAIDQNLIEDNIESRNGFEAKIMATLLPLPHEIIDSFKKLHRISAKKATNWYYKFSQDSNQIRTSKITGDMRWNVSTKYGRLDMFINSEENAFSNSKSSYPKCSICVENEGYAGKENFPAGQNIRNIPITINKENWFFRYSPNNLCNEHCIAFNAIHCPMSINQETFIKLFEFINIFPHYFVGADADLPIVNGEFLFHECLQGGNYEFALNRAPVKKHFKLKKFESVQTGIVNWVLPTIRLRYNDYNKLSKCAEYILNKWKIYTDEEAGIYDSTDGKPHNTITPIARKIGDIYELDIILRNNITTEEYPEGVFHIHPEYRHLKDDNIGLFDVMGLAVLPARLKDELKLAADTIFNGGDLRNNDLTAKHAAWIENFLLEYDDISDDNIMEIFQTEIGHEFVKMLESAAIFKNNEQGEEAFNRFVETLNA